MRAERERAGLLSRSLALQTLRHWSCCEGYGLWVGVGSQLLSRDMVSAVGRAHDAARVQIRSNPWEAIRSVLRHLLPGLDHPDDDGGVGVSLCACVRAAAGTCADDWVGCTVVSRAANATSTSAPPLLAAAEDVAVDADRTMRVFRAAAKVPTPYPLPRCSGSWCVDGREIWSPHTCLASQTSWFESQRFHCAFARHVLSKKSRIALMLMADDGIGREWECQLPTPLLVQLSVGWLGAVRSIAAVWNPNWATSQRLSNSQLPAESTLAGPLVVVPVLLPRAVSQHAHL